MGVAVTYEQIVASISNHLEGELTSGVTLIYPGEDEDTSSISEWAEISFNTLSGDRSRRQSKDQRHLEMLVDIFVKPGANLYRHWEILEDFKNAIGNNTHLQITDFSSSAQTGCIRFLNTGIRPSSREIGDQNKITLRNIRLRFPAIVQED